MGVLSGMTAHPDVMLEFRDHVEADRYEAVLDGQVAGFVDYRRAEGRLVIPRTVTLPAFRGQGVASQLVRHVMDQARRDGLQVTTSCWYVRDWLAAHPEHDAARSA